jgi:hypothetical protein
MKKIIGFFSFSALVAALFFTSCRKEKLQEVLDNLATSQDMSVAQTLLENEEDDIIGDEMGFRGGCVVKTFANAQGVYPQVVTLDFGAGCDNGNGHIRKGKLVINLTADPKTTGAIVTVNPTDFFVDDIRVEGTRTWTNLGKDAAGNRSWKRVVTNGKLTFPNGKTGTFESTETVKQTAGAATAQNKSDDVYEITGSRSGINRNGKTYSATVTKALVKKRDCEFIVSGTLEITKESTSRSLDYGNGDCDNQGTATLADGTTKVITLKRWW